MKHVYLITAYNNWKILHRQLQLLDDTENDIYLLVDLKSKDFSEDLLPELHGSRLFIMKRMKIYWAEFSQVKAMLSMIRKALESGENYSYYHFFSGTCLPLKSQKYIHEFCDAAGKNFIGIVPEEFWYSTKRVRYYYPFVDTTAYKGHKTLKAFVQGTVLMQRLIGINRLKHFDGIIYNGWDWASITGQFAEYLVQQEDMVTGMFRKTLCPSELWIHTLAMNSEFKDTFYDMTDLRRGSMRFIDWKRGKPYTWGQDPDDFRTLMESPYLFARKFDERVNMEIVEKIYRSLKEITTGTENAGYDTP